ncbi:hypothetical protein Hydth_0799 [Hydrogenobacter thermophilus TK-6]|uniref:Uncharacterized protein n=1 Tax=Hydrogenobacter thermophilus (strain DSM 6534 / IAM 12695 / TK-6) TaxID=608538 RepID=D3DHF7_HYDTT|nr:hypothetical protein [Hydrogenobacter thermophilus]ADO45196.1 hypothetical protein Hydth_0799 [Hydrogenobacter thermophilus TK-6]BAI69259.1 hypothetical protein HTH_0799 [Hydrogenobacter thermophilus TK-6]
MKIEELKRIFCENLELLNKNAQWLLKSYEKAENIDFSKKELTDEELEVLETLSNRFGRTVDVLIIRKINEYSKRMNYCQYD